MAQNCWELMGCGRGPGSPQPCAAADAVACDGANHGHNAGRVCWIVAGTLCGGEVQGRFAQKLASCTACPFYERVRAEEAQGFDEGGALIQRLHDPRDVVRAYEQLRRTNRDLQAMQAQLVQAQKMEAVGRLAAGVAHEVNHPLTAILSCAEDLLAASAPDANQAELRTIVDEALRCRAIVRDLLDFARQSRSRRRPVSIGAVIRRVIGLVEKLPSFREIRLEVTRDDHGALVEVDPNQLQQVMLNLITNARDALGGRGGIALRTRHEPETRELVVEVADGGCGIRPEDLERIFEPFFSTKGEQGSGLGLATSRSLVEQNGGTITVESAVGVGTTFRVRLAAFEAEPSAILDGAPAS
ncbi:MAG TPA: ATP-binding protein [Polyangia bacterium]|jgi:signal transduction histidine kinase